MSKFRRYARAVCNSAAYLSKQSAAYRAAAFGAKPKPSTKGKHAA